MSYTVDDFRESLNRLDEACGGNAFRRADVAGCIAAWGVTGDINEWHGGFLMMLKDGRVGYLSGWCDTTGWGCQDGIEATIVSGLDTSSLRDLVWPDGERHDFDPFPTDLNNHLRNERERRMSIAGMNPGENPQRASLIEALDSATGVLNALALDDPRRGEVARRIVQIQDALDALGDDL